MVKAVWKDLLVDLIDEVNRLGEAQRRQELTTQRIEKRMDLLVEHSRELAHGVEGVERQLGVLTEQMGVLHELMGGICEQRVAKLEKKSA